MSVMLLDRPAISDDLTRRGLLTISGAAALGLGLAACGVTTTGSSAPAVGGPWRFTDDVGALVELPVRPVRVASLDNIVTATLWRAGLHPVSTGRPDLLDALGISDGSSLVATSSAGTAVDLEALANARPDLIVDFAEGGRPAQTALLPQIADVAPVVALAMNDSTAAEIITAASRLAAAVTGSSTEPAGKADYESAFERLRATLAARPGLRVACCSVKPDKLTMWAVDRSPLQRTLRDAGVEFVSTTITTNGYAEEVSWENAPDLPVDAIVTVRWFDPTGTTWDRLPAVAAGQVLILEDPRWAVYSYTGYAALLTNLATFFETAAIVGPQ